MCKVSISCDTARMTKATLKVTLIVVCFFMALSLKNAATSALSDYVNNVIALWWLLDYVCEYSFAKTSPNTSIGHLTECLPTLRESILP